MRIVVMLLVIVGVAFFFYKQRKEQQQLMVEREAREQAQSEAMYARQEKRNEAIREQAVQRGRERREDEIRRNAPERERIAREFPDAYRNLGVKAGRNLEDCLVTMRDLHFTSYDKAGNQYKQVMIQAQCGPSFEEQVFGN